MFLLPYLPNLIPPSPWGIQNDNVLKQNKNNNIYNTGSTYVPFVEHSSRTRGNFYCYL